MKQIPQANTTLVFVGTNELAQEKYDYIIIDTPPSLGLLAINAFFASDKLLVPASTGFFALIGSAQLRENIAMVRQTQLSPDPPHLARILDPSLCAGASVARSRGFPQNP